MQTAHLPFPATSATLQHMAEVENRDVSQWLGAGSITLLSWFDHIGRIDSKGHTVVLLEQKGYRIFRYGARRCTRAEDLETTLEHLSPIPPKVSRQDARPFFSFLFVGRATA